MRDWFTRPEGETDEAHITPTESLAYRVARLETEGKRQTVHPVVLLTFQRSIAEQFVQETHAHPAGEGFSMESTAPLWNGTLGVASVSIQKLPVGAPAAAIAFEMLIAGGATTFLVAGTAGSLTPDAPIGSVLIPTGARREEGTSFHYLPPEANPLPDDALVALLIEVAARRGSTPLTGRVWTVDAIYREVGWKVRQYAREGILAVDMELSALLAIAQVRGVRLAASFVISDELFHPWRPGWHVEEFVTGQRLAANLALDAAARLQVARAEGRG